ncbi:MAG: hypothetical protein ACOYMN_22465 [Roseimicrobium sp.]
MKLRTPASFATAWFACLVLTTIPSCKRITERMEITEVREIPAARPLPKAHATSGERFFENPAPENDVPQENPLTWATPAGWSEAPSGDAAMGGMRLINLRFGPSSEGECYLSAIPGAAGGLEANVNRWRTQMGQAAYSSEELAKLPTKKFLGRDAAFVAFDGDFKGMGATEALKGYRLLGVVQQAPEFTLFVKMTGPKELVSANEAAFDAFCQSISIRR